MEKEKVPPPGHCLMEKGLQRAQLHIVTDVFPQESPRHAPTCVPQDTGLM